MELIKVLTVSCVSAGVGGLITFFITTIASRGYTRSEVGNAVKVHTNVCREKFKAGNEKFETQDKRLDMIEKETKQINKTVLWVAIKMGYNENDN